MLYGRDVERARIDALLAGARESRSAVLVVRGEAGIGKSSLLEYAIAATGDMPVLRATGLESESELGIASRGELARLLPEDGPAPQVTPSAVMPPARGRG